MNNRTLPARPGESRAGIALVATLAIMVVVAMLVLGSVLTTQIELAITSSDTAIAQAQYVAQAGLQTQKAQLFQAYQWLLSGNGTADPCASTIDAGIDFQRSGSAAMWIDNRISFLWDETDGAAHPNAITSATGELVGFFDATLIRFASSPNVITIQSVGHAGTGRATSRATSTASATFILSTGSALETAIFAGAGSGGGQMINGNARVFGGIYIEGAPLLDQAGNPVLNEAGQPRFDEDRLVFDAGGNFGMYNSYDYDTLATGQFNPANRMREPLPRTLCATLRVAHGRAEVGSNVELGTPDDPLYTVAVGQPAPGVVSRITNKKGDEIDTDSAAASCRDNRGVCSIQGVTTFDLDEAPTFPRLNLPPANTSICGTGISWRECVINESEAVITEANYMDDFSGADGSCEALFATAIGDANRVLRFDTSDLICREAGGAGFTYTYNAATDSSTLELHGDVTLRGFNVHFVKPVEYATSNSAGNAHLFVEADGANGGSLRVDKDFVPSSDREYPDVVVALLAERALTLNGGQFRTVVAPVYAGEIFRIASNTTLIGQVIADEFCSGATESAGGEWDPNDLKKCTQGGAPADIVYYPTDNRPAAYRAVTPDGGTPTYALLSYEMR